MAACLVFFFSSDGNAEMQQLDLTDFRIDLSKYEQSL